MLEQRDRTSPGAEHPPNLDYRKTLVQAGRKLQPLDLSGREKTQILIAVSDTLFPKEADGLKAGSAIDGNEYRESVDFVFGSPKLFIAFKDLISQLTDDPGQLNIVRGIHYKNTWEKSPKTQMGEPERRLLIILEEHRERYPGIPVNLATIGQAMGGASKQRVWQIWGKLETENRIPEGVTKTLPRGRPHKKPA